MKEVRFSEDVVVHYIPIDNCDRRPFWLLEQAIFKFRIELIGDILKPVLLKHLTSIDHGAKGTTSYDTHSAIAGSDQEEIQTV